MKPNLNPCAACGGEAAIRGEAGIAVVICAQCGRMVGPFEASAKRLAAETAASAWNEANPKSM